MGVSICSSFAISAAILFLIFNIYGLPLALAQSPAPGPAPMTSDGTSIDQAVACLLMLVALVLTYLIH